jgi:hypothetical protein
MALLLLGRDRTSETKLRRPQKEGLIVHPRLKPVRTKKACATWPIGGRSPIELSGRRWLGLRIVPCSQSS